MDAEVKSSLRFPVSITEAAEALKISRLRAAVGVDFLGIPTSPDARNGKARMLDGRGFNRLAKAVQDWRAAATA